ncbi:MAG: poly-gamma-glutamate system protein, partial [Candidatus Hydrogenedentota bacterium]
MYRNWVKPKLPLRYAIVFLLTCGAGLYVSEKTKVQTKHINFDRQVEAAHIMKESLREVKAHREAKHIPLNREFDVNETGIIGEAFTPLTTSVGDIAAKRTATNPAFAALMVRLFSEAGLTSGDVVAIGASGSFPSLILATLSAANVMQLRPLLIYSLGSSMYGANIPEFTFIDMLSVLNNKGLLPYEPIAFSLGGGNDRADALLDDSQRAIFFEVAESTEIPLIYENSVSASMKRRIELYEGAAAGHPIRCFVNIGGATANYGKTAASLKIPNGLVTGKTPL